MRVGIITFINEDNYGAVLQAYAMQSFLIARGVDVEFVNIKLTDYRKKKTTWIVQVPKKIAFFRKHMSFQKFRRQLLISKTQDIEKYEVLLIGSDQVWNPTLMGDDLQSIFWGENSVSRIVGYACSCGNTQVLSGYEERIKRYLNKFSAISCREYSLSVFLKKLGISRVCTVLDPVFLLSVEQWRHHMNLTTKKRRYLLVYLLEDSDVITQAVNEISVKENLNVISFRNVRHYVNERKRYPGASPQEFVDLFYNAEIIVSNSFHALAFSYIFKKKIALFPHSLFNERISDFLQMINVSSDSYYNISRNVIDLASVYSEKFVQTRKNSIEYLLKALDIK